MCQHVVCVIEYLTQFMLTCKQSASADYTMMWEKLEHEMQLHNGISYSYNLSSTLVTLFIKIWPVNKCQ